MKRNSGWKSILESPQCREVLARVDALAIALKTPAPQTNPTSCNIRPASVVPNAAAWEAVAMGKHRIKPNYRRRILDFNSCAGRSRTNQEERS